MNIYEFDNTIYDGDSCKDIVLYGLKKYPKIAFKSLLKARIKNKDYKKKKIEFEIVKESLLSFIFKINDYQKFINEFVKSHMKKIKPWYLSKKKKDDIIVSASYDLWINEFAKKLGVKNVIATKVNSEGKIIGKNCKREEKVRRIKESFKNRTFMEAYSDSEADLPILKLAKVAYVVEGNNIIKYKNGYKFKNNK